jgi:hypothetical protein
MTPAFPFHDGQRFLIDDDQEHVHTVLCRVTPKKAAAGDTPVMGTGLSLATAGGLPVVYRPDTGMFRIPVLGRNAIRRARV